MLLCLIVSVLLTALTGTEACDFCVCACECVLNAIFFFLRTDLLQVLNFILNFVDRKPAVSIFQDVLKLLFTNSLVIPL